MGRLVLGVFVALLFGVQPAAADDWEVIGNLRVLVQNIYGRDEKSCGDRYRTIARKILEANPPYDIVALNEHWDTALGELIGKSCDSDILTGAIRAGGRYRDTQGRSRSRMSYPRGGTFQFDGGNSILTTYRILEFKSEVYGNSNDVPVVGYQLARIELSPGVAVDFWLTHLESGSDGCNDACKLRQSSELAAAISRESGWRQGREWDGNPVLVAGDFNLNCPVSVAERFSSGGFPGYEGLMAQFGSPLDLWLQAQLASGPDEGYTYDPRTNSIASGRARERIDYLFSPLTAGFSHSLSRIRTERIEVVRWQTPSGVPVSDHYGLDARLDIVRPRIELPSASGGGIVVRIR